MILRRRDQSADLIGRIGMMTAEVLEQTEYGIRRDEGDGDVEGIAVRERIADFIMHGEAAWTVRDQRWLIAFGGVLRGSISPEMTLSSTECVASVLRSDCG